MALTQDLVNQFVKMTNDNKKEKQEVTVKATYKKINGEDYAQLDGSDIWTPVTCTVEAETGERVTVLLKNHTATVTGNISSPSARTKSVENLKTEVDKNGNIIKQLDNNINQQNNSINQINNSITQINNAVVQANNTINQQNNVIKQIGDNIVSINNQIDSQNNEIEMHSNEIKYINNTVDIQNNDIKELGNSIVLINNRLNVQGSNIEVIGSDVRIINSGFTIEDGVLKGLSQIIIDTLTTNNAYIDFANIGVADVAKLFATAGVIKDLIVSQGNITGELVGVTIKGDLIQGNTIQADKLVILGEDGLYYQLNLDGLNNVSTTKASKFVLLLEQPYDWTENFTKYYMISNDAYIHVPDSETVPIWTADTYYKLSSEHESGLDGTNILAKTITANKIMVNDLFAFDATIGGFIISENAIHSIGKNSISSNANGVYADKDGQIFIGGLNDYIKFFKDENNQWKMQISANDIKYGSNGVYTTISDAFKAVNTTITDNENNMKAVMRYAIETDSVSGTSGTLTIGYENKQNPTNYYTKIDNDEIRFISIYKNPQSGAETVTTYGRMVKDSLVIDKVHAKNELIVGNSQNGGKFRWRDISGNGMVLEKIN